MKIEHIAILPISQAKKDNSGICAYFPDVKSWHTVWSHKGEWRTFSPNSADDNINFEDYGRPSHFFEIKNLSP